MRDHISSSQVDTYLRCGRQWFYRYRMGLVVPPTGALTTGKSIHSALEHNFSQKIKSGNDLHFDQVEGVFEESLKEQKEETVWEEEFNFDAALQTGSKALKVHHEKLAPTIQPVHVESKFTFPITETVDLTGIIDLIDTNDVIIDHKTSKTSWNQTKVDKHLQLSFYAAAVYHNVPDNSPIDVRVDTLIFNKTPKAEQWSSQRTVSDAARALSIARYVISGIQAEVFLPAESGAWCCDPKWCGYYDRCMQDLTT